MQVSIFQHHGSHLGVRMSKMLAFTPLGQQVPLGFFLLSSGSGRMALGIFWLVTELALEEEATEGAAV